MQAQATSPQLFKDIPLKDISFSKTNPRNDFDEVAIKELAESIKQKGVLQPIVVRWKGEKFELVCGERRLRASKIAGKDSIPAVIRDLNDADAFDLQITENLQRKDLHPMDEAVAFKSLIDRTKVSVAEVAKRFGKSETFVAQRIKFNDLLPDAKKMFYEGKMLTGHALLISRLQPDDQKECLEHCKEYGSRDLESVSDIERWIQHHVICNLSSAAFKKDDATLLPKAGACITCPKRSGANQSLFPDIKQQDRCFDRTCFSAKLKIHTIAVVTRAIEQEPNVLLIYDSSSQSLFPEVKKLVDDHKLKVLKPYSDYNTPRGKEKGNAEALYVNGDDAGKKVKIILKGIEKTGAAPGAKPATVNQAAAEIAGINQRQERAKELDAEKVYARVLEAVKQHPTRVSVKIAANAFEKIALMYLLADSAGGMYDGEVKKMFAKHDLDDPDFFAQTVARLTNLSDGEYAYLLRDIFLNKYPANNPFDVPALFIKRIAKIWGIPVDEFEKEQKEIADKRIARAKQRIDELKAPKIKSF